MSGFLPNFIIIGAKRSGTTSLHACLRAHPEVLVAPNKEVHFFDHNFDKGLEWYKAKFAGVTTELAIGEATPNYMYSGDALDRMAKVLPEAKLIAILRNPVDRAYSHYWHRRVRGREPLEFAEAIARESIQLAGGDRYTNQDQLYVDQGRYLAQLQRVCELYPREALKVVLLEDLHRAPAETYASICRFLGVEDSFIPGVLGTVANSNVAFRSLRLREVYRVPWLPRVIREPTRRIVGKINTKKASYPCMDPAVRAQLLKTFEKDNAELARWLGRDLSEWNG